MNSNETNHVISDTAAKVVASAFLTWIRTASEASPEFRARVETVVKAGREKAKKDAA